MRLLPLFVFWGLWFLNYSTRICFSPILPLIEDGLHLSHGASGGLFTSLSVGYSLALLVSGRFASEWGYKRTVAIGFVCTGLVFVGLQWADSYLAFHVLVFLMGIAAGTYIPAILPILTGTYEARHWGKALGFHDSAASFSILVVPILMVFGLQFFSWRGVLLILGFACFLLPVLFWKISSEPARAVQEKKLRMIDLLKKRSTWISGLLWTVSSGSSSGLYSVLPLYLIKERGIDFELANTLFGLSRIGGVFISILIGFLIDRYGYRSMLRLSILTTGLSTILFSLATSVPLILASLFLQATLSLAFFPIGFAVISKLTAPSERSLVTGLTVAFGVIFGSGIVPFLLGLTADHLNFQVGILGLGVVTAFSSLGVGSLAKNEE
jgi:NNP family nitrate/nitrite transporter-like MFS transporter